MLDPVQHEDLYLLLRCRAEQIALRDRSAELVIATPPYHGTRGVPRKDCCPCDPRSFGAFLARCLGEAMRIVKPGGYVLIHTRKTPLNSTRGLHRVVFQVLKKSAVETRQTIDWLKVEKFRVHFVRVKGVNWYGFPVSFYQILVRRYSRPGARVVHIFSGTGNSAIAALNLSRFPILIDLNHHQQVQRRLDKLFQPAQLKQYRKNSRA